MLVIRFNRFGKKNQAAFRIVLQEKTKAPGRRHVEMLGSYNPHTKVTTLEKERVLYWIGQGAEPSDRVHNLLIKEKVIEGKIIPKKMPRPVKKEEAVKAPEATVAAPAEATPTAEEKAPEAPVAAPVVEAKVETPEAEVKKEAVSAEQPVEAKTPTEVPAEASKEEVKA